MKNNGDESPKSKSPNKGTLEIEDVEQTNDNDDNDNDNGMGDKAALVVMLYLLFIFVLLVGAIFIGFFVIEQYGFVVLVAVCSAGLAMFVVAATLMSVIARDAKLRKAQSKIKSWHSTCKDEIMKSLKKRPKRDVQSSSSNYQPPDIA